RRTTRRRLTDPDILAIAIHTPLGDRRPLGRRRRRAVRRLPDIPGSSSRGPGRPGSTIATPAPGAAARRASAGLIEQPAPRFQAQAISAGHGVRRRRAPRRLARLVPPGRAARASDSKRTREPRIPAVLRRVPRHPIGGSIARRARTYALSRSQGL